MGRPLPGSAEVRIARYDLDAGGLVLRADGFARECGVDEVGMLMARVRPDEQLSMIPLRGVFASGDAWLLTGDLFRRDADGDYWRVNNLADVIESASGPVFPGLIRDALGDLPAVDLVVAYGVPAHDSEHDLAVAAVTLRRGHQLYPRDIAASVSGLERHQRPQAVRVVEQIPVTTWYRPVTGPLRREGIPEPVGGEQAWYLDSRGEHYRPLTSTARRRLVGTESG